MPVEVHLQDLIRLGFVTADESCGSIKKVAQRLMREKKIQSWRSGTGLFILQQKVNQDCLMLDSKTRLCTCYENRPDVCRKFPTEMGARTGYCPYIKKIT